MRQVPPDVLQIQVFNKMMNSCSASIMRLISTCRSIPQLGLVYSSSPLQLYTLLRGMQVLEIDL